MELRCFLVPGDGPSTNCPYVDIPSAPLSSNRHHEAVKVLGRHSSELYWLLGNNPHYSRRMMSVWMEEEEEGDSEEMPLADRVHPQLAQRLMLKCIGKNTLAVSRRLFGVGHDNQSSEEGRFFLHTNDIVTLHVGDSIGVINRVWLQVVLALVCVNDTTKVPLVVPQREDNAITVPACSSLCLQPQNPRLPPVVRVDRPWMKLPLFVRSSLVNSVWCQQNADFGVMGPARKVVSGTGQTLSHMGHEADDGMEEAAAISNTSQMPCDGGTLSICGEKRSKRRQYTSSSDSCTAESHVLSLEVAPSQKRRRASIVDGGGAGFSSPVPMVENNTYNDTCDEPLYDDLRALELRAAVVNQLITTGPPMPVILGESPPREGRSGGMKRGSQRGTSVTVSRTQLRHGNKEQEEEQQQPPDLEGVTRNHPAREESQVVYYGR